MGAVLTWSGINHKGVEVSLGWLRFAKWRIEPVHTGPSYMYDISSKQMGCRKTRNITHTHTRKSRATILETLYLPKVIGYAGEFLSPPNPGRRFPCFNINHPHLPKWRDPSDLLCLAEQLRTGVGSHAIEVLGVSKANMTEIIQKVRHLFVTIENYSWQSYRKRI